MDTDPPSARDPGLPLLTGDDAGDLLAAALAHTGGEPARWAVDQVDHQPGISTTVSYHTWVRWPRGSVTREILAATTGRLPDTAVRLTDGNTEVGIWRFPFDPQLPALRDACDPDRVETLLGARPNRLRLRAHRPGRRAVVEATTPAGTVFLKVARPDTAAASQLFSAASMLSGLEDNATALKAAASQYLQALEMRQQFE